MDPTKKELYTAKRNSGLNTNADPNVQLELDLVKNHDKNWALLRIEGTNLMFYRSGSQGYSELVGNLDDNDVYYGVYKIEIQKQIKFFHIYFVGESVNGMKKGKASLYKQTVFNLIDAHGEIQCPGGVSEFTSNFIQSEIAKLTRLPLDNIQII